MVGRTIDQLCDQREGVINKIDATITLTRAAGDYNGNPFGKAMGEVLALVKTAFESSVDFLNTAV